MDAIAELQVANKKHDFFIVTFQGRNYALVTTSQSFI